MKIFITLILILISASGCSQSQLIAAQSMENGLNHAHVVYVNTSDMAKQLILNSGAYKAKKAAEDGNVEAAQASVQYVFDYMQNLSYLNIQWERSRALLRTPQEYIWSRRHILSIVHDDIQQIKKRMDAKQEAELVSE